LLQIKLPEYVTRLEKSQHLLDLGVQSAGDDNDFQTPKCLLPLCSLLAKTKTQNSMYQCGFTVC
jgi:hypothetical protein